MNEVTMGADKLLDLVSKFNFDAKSDGRDWDDLYEDIVDIIHKANKISNAIEVRMRGDK